MYNPMGNDPLLLALTFMRSGKNPMDIINQQARNDPKIGRALDMIQGKSPQQLEQMARNIAREKGIDLDAAMHQLGMK